jgi:large subunit ribosomal protein L9
MKVVLKRDVKDTGRAHDVIEVSDGHALNFLIPKGMALLATPANLKNAEVRRKAVSDRKDLDKALVKERVAALAEGSVTVTKKANEKGHLYDAVDAEEIAKAAELPVETIRLEKPIKEIGTFQIPVSAGEDFGEFTLTIAAE